MSQTQVHQVSAELRAWVAQQRADGFSSPALLVSMREAGWDEAAAQAALAESADGGSGETGGSGGQRAALSKAANSGMAANAADATLGRPMPGLAQQDGALTIDAGDRRVRILQTMKHPRLVVFGDLLSEEECEALIADARKRLARSLTVETKTGGEIVNVDRTSDGMFFERGETDVVRRIEARIAKLLAWPLEFGEGLQVLRYAPGAQYRPHYDYFDPNERGTPTILARGGQRVATLVMYIGEPARGGATTFPDVGLEVAPQRGSAVFFSYDRPDPATRSLHGGAPVLEGEKWVATKWLREREFI